MVYFFLSLLVCSFLLSYLISWHISITIFLNNPLYFFEIGDNISSNLSLLSFFSWPI